MFHKEKLTSSSRSYYGRFTDEMESVGNCGLVTINEEFVANEQINNYMESQNPESNPPPAKIEGDEHSESHTDQPESHQPLTPSELPEAVKQEQAMDSAEHQEQKPKASQDPQQKSPAEKSGRKKPARNQGAQKPEQEQPAKTGDDNQSPKASPGRAGAAQGTLKDSAGFPHMEAVNRVLALPVVDAGVHMMTGVYSRVKNINPLVQWSLGTAEGGVKTAFEHSLTLLTPLSGPLSVVDALLCRGLDMVEYKMPIITLPPEVLVSTGRDYMTTRVVAPVLRITASNARLADSIASRALDSADHYVDMYLPGDASTENGDVGSPPKPVDALRRADRLSRKLQRRLTHRTIAEARALRKHSEDTLHTLMYLADTLIKDPRAFVEQCRAVWAHLSENEPGNQVPPATLEERVALLVREVARRVVHLVNYTAASANSAAASNAASYVIQSVRMEGARVLSYAQHQIKFIHMKQVVDDLNQFTHQLLDRLARLLAGLRSSAHGRHFHHTAVNNVAVVE